MKRPGRASPLRTLSRRLSPEEAALWARVAETVEPLAGRKRKAEDVAVPAEVPADVAPQPPLPKRIKGRVPQPLPAPAPAPPTSRPLDRHGLDASWDRRLAKGAIEPDFTLDLHGHTLETAYTRLEMGLGLALAQGARVVLLVTGRPRPQADQAGRGSSRGAIRAKFLDWLSHGAHAHRIAAVRAAHPRHGGAGAVYIVLRRGK